MTDFSVPEIREKEREREREKERESALKGRRETSNIACGWAERQSEIERKSSWTKKNTGRCVFSLDRE